MCRPASSRPACLLIHQCFQCFCDAEQICDACLAKRTQSSISNWFNVLQMMVDKEVPTLEGLLAGTRLSDNTVLSELLNAEAGLDVDVNRPDLINRGNAA